MLLEHLKSGGAWWGIIYCARLRALGFSLRDESHTQVAVTVPCNDTGSSLI
jgi:hypothetical protein